MSKAVFELGYADQYDQQVVNDVLRVAIDETHDIILDFVNQ